GSVRGEYETGAVGPRPAGLRADCRVAGLSHALAASGFHLTGLLGAVLAIGRGLGRWARLGLGAGAMALFLLLAGPQPSVVRAVLMGAQRRGEFSVRGRGVVLFGHSMGALSALLAAGVVPEAGLAERCRKALDRLPIANPSRLLQCQLPSTDLPKRSSPPADLRGLVLLNSFGSLLWPRRGLASLGVPVLMVGGSLDLVTPPLEEQLRLFLQARDPRSRLVMVEGGSHFSPVRLMPTDEVLFRLDEDLVGVDPALVQSALLRLTTEYLQTLEQPLLLPAQRRVQQGVTLDVLDAAAARRWKAALKP
ncbi:ComEC/Rec2 family competence protein, partial [Synechococcus sp. BA-120 BA3]|nr:ComEC/Rec2 family competence protein [Synechococcus sp. BA-120 BA3]